jgi:hypothetical protein
MNGPNAHVAELVQFTRRHNSQLDACRVVSQPRGTQRYTAIVRADERTEAGLNHSKNRYLAFYDRRSKLIGQLGR